MVFLKDFFKKVDFEKNNRRWQESTKDYPTCEEVLGQDSWKTQIIKEPSLAYHSAIIVTVLGSAVAQW